MNARHAIRVVLAAAVLLVFAGTASAFGGVRDLFVGTNADSRIAFTSFRNGSFDLYITNADGSKQRRLTPARNTSSPAWSPDGRRIAFESGSGACILDGHFVGERNAGTGDVDISVANANGSGLRRLTRGAGVDCAPAWSPDGRKIAFQRSLVRREGDRVVGFDFDIYVINADGSGERNLTGDALSAGGPLWSPDGRKIVFWSGPDGNGWVYVMNADGSERRMLARNHGYVAWSPDGRKILLRRGGAQGDRRGVGATKAYAVVNADGSGLRTLTRIAGVNGQSLSWSPDGGKIVYVSDRDGNQEVYVMNADGSGQRNLTRNPVTTAILNGRPTDGRSPSPRSARATSRSTS